MKTILSLGLLALMTVSSFGQKFQSLQFLADIVATNAVNGRYAGVTVTNNGSAPLGGFTNINSWLSTANGTVVGTNSFQLTYTNFNGIWVIPTNNTPVQSSGVFTLTNDSTALVRDLPLWSASTGQLPVTVVTNSTTGDTAMLSPVSLSCRIWGAASAANTLNLVFVGLPDGVNEVTGANATPLTFQWGITAAAGTTVVSTNFPTWKFAGCKSLRLRSATLTTTAAANIGVTIQSLNLNGFVP